MWQALRPSSLQNAPETGSCKLVTIFFHTLRDALVELFELDPERVTLESNLYQDLEIDSIDAVDLIDHIKRQTGKKNRRRRIQVGAHRQ
nr:hypothetical protein GCM10020185_25850 [Pseudomonas brassicacearum subsp. brassicacearum]